MRLSDAIRLGSMFHPQGYGLYRTSQGLCAMGAALYAVGELTLTESARDYTSILVRLWPIVTTRTICGPPECRRDGIWSVLHIIMCLNDTHRWTRERIADWVESQEVIADLEAASATARVAPSLQPAHKEG